MKLQNYIAFSIFAALLATIGMTSILSSGVSAQTNNMTNMTTGNQNMTATMDHNMTGMDMGMGQHDYGMDKEYEPINGTINMMEAMYQGIASRINVTLNDAITTAEQSVGNNSYAMVALSQEKDGFMVYSIILGTPNMEFYKVIVDPGNGQVLASNELSMMEWMMMHEQLQHEGGMMKGGGMHEYGQDKGGYGKDSYEKGGSMEGMHDYTEYGHEQKW
jgi:uncharacterized membrane protein YkoI